jgi:hypothetical protein
MHLNRPAPIGDAPRLTPPFAAHAGLPVSFRNGTSQDKETHMKAIGYHSPLPITSDNSLTDLDLPAPTPKPGDLLVRVQAISVNPCRRKAARRVAPAALARS